MSNLKRVLLYSGGLDSWLIDKIWKPDIKIYIDMGTKYSEIEISKLPPNVTVLSFKKLGRYSLPNDIIPLRNLYLYAIAANYTGFQDVEICLGALNGDRINDKTKNFADKLNELMQYLYEPQQSQPGRRIKISMPFKQYSKREMLDMYIRRGGSYKKAYYSTFSCYNPANGCECLSCKACFRKSIPFIAAGASDEIFTNDQKRRIKKYAETVVKSNIDDYTKDKGKEGVDCLKALKIIESWSIDDSCC